MVSDTDILISGGGVAGLSAAAAFGAAGFRTICVDPAPPVTDASAQGADLRTTAFLQPARDFLDEIGVWPRLAPHATPLQVMRIVDLAGRGAPTTHDFDAQDLSDRPFGWNVPNWLLRRELVAHLDTLADVDFRAGRATGQVLPRTTEIRVRFDDRSGVRARLVVAADGRNSPVRQAVGLGARTIRYGQTALAFAVTHPAPHENISTEIHASGGPFTLVPLPDRDGAPCSAVVWMERTAEARRLFDLPIADFEAAMTERSGQLYGALRLATRRSLWPIITQVADRLTAQRTALVAEAAHVVPPIGAQGLNMSLGDIATLRSLAMARPDGLGDSKMLSAYARARRPEILARAAGIDALNRASMAGVPVLQMLRAAATDLLHGTPPLRRTAMRLGLGHSTRPASGASAPNSL